MKFNRNNLFLRRTILSNHSGTEMKTEKAVYGIYNMRRNNSYVHVTTAVMTMLSTMLLTFFLLLSLRKNECILADSDLGEVVFATVLYRHGDRTPSSTYPNDPHNQSQIWPEGLGQLTPIGREQLYELGTFIRSRYKYLLPEKYNVDDIYVRSSSTDRCLMSAQCNLFALYPNTANVTTPNVPFQPVPIHSTDTAHDEIFYADEFCERYSKALSLVQASEPYQCVMNVTEEIRKSVAQYAGEDSFDSGIYSILFIEDLYNLTLPDWAEDYYPEPLKSLYLFDGFVDWIATRELQKYSMGPFIGQIVSNIKLKSQGSLVPDRKLFVYSGHDATIYNLLMSLNINNGILPPYASCVFIELRAMNEEYYVTVQYRNSTNNDPFLLKLPECDELCPLNDFLNLTKFLIPEDFESECQDEPAQDVDFLIPPYGIPEEWLHCFSENSEKDKL